MAALVGICSHRAHEWYVCVMSFVCATAAWAPAAALRVGRRVSGHRSWIDSKLILPRSPNKNYSLRPSGLCHLQDHLREKQHSPMGTEWYKGHDAALCKMVVEQQPQQQQQQTSSSPPA